MTGRYSIEGARAALQNPALSPDELYAIVRNFPELTTEAARHPNAYPELKEWAAQNTGQSSGEGEPNSTKSRKVLWWSLVGIAGVVVLALVAWLVVIPSLSNSGKNEVFELIDDQVEARQNVLDARDNAIAALNDVLDRTKEYQGLTYLEVEDTNESREQIATVAADPDTYFALVNTVTRVEDEIPAESPTKKEVQEQSPKEREETREELEVATEVCTGLLNDLEQATTKLTESVDEKLRGESETALRDALDEGESVYADSEGQVEDENIRDILRELLDEGTALLKDSESSLNGLETKREEIIAQTDTVRDASVPSFESMFGRYQSELMAYDLTSSGLEFAGWLCGDCGGLPDPLETYVDYPRWDGSCFTGSIYSDIADRTNELRVCPAGRGGPGNDSVDRIPVSFDGTPTDYVRQ